MVSAITAADLRDRIDEDEAFVLIDTRDPEDFEGWHVHGAHNVAYSATHSELRGDLEGLEDELDLASDDELVTICAKGVASSAFAEVLEERGYVNVATVSDGMEGWSRVYDVVEIPTRREHLELWQVQRRAKGCLSYVVADADAGEAAVVDPSRHLETYLELADERGYEVVAVFDTHVHADHLSGGRELADELDVPYHLGRRVETRDPDFAYEPLERNEVVQVGDVDVKALFTPGHTTGMTSYLIGDEALLSGDGLFVESIARTELQFAGEDAKHGARVMYDSLHKTVLAEPDSVKVLPAHFSLSDDGEAIDVTPGEPMYSEIGLLRRHNEALSLEEEEFVEHMFENLPSKPPNYETVIATNLGHRELEDESEATELELGPNRCAASADSMVAND